MNKKLRSNLIQDFKKIISLTENIQVKVKMTDKDKKWDKLTRKKKTC